MGSQRRLSDAGPMACSKIWFETEGEYVFAAGIARLNQLKRDVAAYSHRRFVELCDLEENGGRR